MLTVGMSVLVGGGSTGEAPSSAPTGSLAKSERSTLKYTPIEAAITTAPRANKSLALVMSKSLSADLDALFIRCNAAETPVG
jgi:hypothetical protein